MHWNENVDKWIAENDYILVKVGFLNRDAEIIKMCYEKRLTRRAIGDIFNITATRVNQIYKGGRK